MMNFLLKSLKYIGDYVRKRFDRKLYEENDRKAKEAVAKLFEGTKYSVKENTKKTAVDLLLYKGEEHVGYVECEFKRVWTGDFEYDTLQIPQRKHKYAQLDKPTYFVVFNHNASEYMAVTGEDLLKSQLKEVPNKYVYQGECFFQVPVKKTHKDLIKLIKGDKNG